VNSGWGIRTLLDQTGCWAEIRQDLPVFELTTPLVRTKGLKETGNICRFLGSGWGHSGEELPKSAKCRISRVQAIYFQRNPSPKSAVCRL
jgi:hypothetical protein